MRILAILIGLALVMGCKPINPEPKPPVIKPIPPAKVPIVKPNQVEIKHLPPNAVNKKPVVNPKNLPKIKY